MIADIDWVTLKEGMETRGPRPFLARLVQRTPVVQPTLPEQPPEACLASRLTAANSLEERRVLVRDFVIGELRSTLGLERTASIDPDQGFFAMGMDSLMAVQFRRALQTATGLALQNTLTFNYPNIAALTTHLLALMAPPEASLDTSNVEEEFHGSELDGLSEFEVERLLAEELRTLPQEWQV